ncbi:protein FAM161A [Lates calcarifer]|nr:protein FAM161A [Lates calcarifer]
MTTKKQFRFQPKVLCTKPQGRLSRKTEARVRSNSKVTVPKPFQMMLREEERKRHKVRTRSEIELENTLLRQELEELRECQKKFRASPAPVHIHLPLYEIISRRSTQRFNKRRSSSNNCNHGSKKQPGLCCSLATAFPFPGEREEEEGGEDCGRAGQPWWQRGATGLQG